MSERFPSQTQDKFTVRFPEGMRDAIAERAKDNGRSMNSEIITMLSVLLNSEGNDDGDFYEILDKNKASELELIQEKIINYQAKAFKLLKMKTELLTKDEKKAE